MTIQLIHRRADRELDNGKRCERHVGEVFPPRCFDCDHLAGGAAIDRGEDRRLSALISRAGFIPGSECPLHPNYPRPCDRCKRDAAGLGVAA